MSTTIIFTNKKDEKDEDERLCACSESPAQCFHCQCSDCGHCVNPDVKGCHHEMFCTCAADDDDDHDDDDDDPSCEHCLCPDGDIIVHSWGCVAFCERCSDIDEQPHCPRESHSGDAEKCEYCVEGWAWIDARLPVTYKGGIIGYSKPGESGICKFSNRHH